MSATNSTTNYALPIFIGTDKPAWLVDWNGAMTAIDAAIKGVDTDVQGAITSISGLSSTVASHTSSISTISGQITTITGNLNSAIGNINTINSLIGNGVPTTTDHTLIGAINELNADKASGAEVGTLASLTTTDKTDIVSAINEVNGKKYTKVCEVTCDGVKTISTIYDEIYALLAAANIDLITPLKMIYSDSSNNAVFELAGRSSTAFTFVQGSASSGFIANHAAVLRSSGSTQGLSQINSGNTYSYTDESSTVWSNGAKVTVVY